ncbi:MAG: glycosyltransferase [Terrimicrobiaceae bacterium]
MRVVHICNLPLTTDHPDARRLTMHPGRWVLNLAQAQKAHTDILPELVVQVPGASREHITEVEGIPVHFLAAPNRLRAATLFYFDVKRISRYVRKLAPDLVHAHGTEESYLLAAQATGLPNLVTAQGCYFIINREFSPKLVSRARAVEFTEWLGLRRAKNVIAKSKYVAEELRKKFPHLNIHEIPNTFDARLLDIPLAREREPGSLAFVGTIVKRKGVHILAQALEILKAESGKRKVENQKIRLHVFGNRPDNPSPYEQSIISNLQSLLGDRVIFHGTVPALEVAGALSRIELLVAPSLEEMFGNQVIEALLVGCQPIVTGGTAMAENLRRLDCGTIVPQGDPFALAEAIAYCLALSRQQWQTGDPQSAHTVSNQQSRADREETDERSSPAGLSEAKAIVRKRILDWMGPETIARSHEAVYASLTT